MKKTMMTLFSSKAMISEYVRPCVLHPVIVSVFCLKTVSDSLRMQLPSLPVYVRYDSLSFASDSLLLVPALLAVRGESSDDDIGFDDTVAFEDVFSVVGDSNHVLTVNHPPKQQLEEQ